MILGLGLMISVYLVFLVLPGAQSMRVSKQKTHMVGRTAILVVSVYQLLIIDSLINWQGEIVLMDGLCRINSTIIICEIYIQVLIITILHFQAIYTKRPELYLLIQSNVIGLIYMISSNDWVISITAWELFNLSLYLITSVNCESEAALSAAIKYFLQSALTTTLLLLSIALLYALTGSTHYDSINLSIIMMETELFLWPLLLIIIPLQFKLGAAPLHNVSIDLYDSLPTSITFYIINISKLAVLLFMLQLAPLWSSNPSTLNLIIFTAIISMIVGSIGLGSQLKIKRFLTYSSISHLGFMLLALASLQIDSFFQYAFIYFLNSITIFAILLVIGQVQNREILFIRQIAGLWKMNLPLALIFILSLFSLAGIPPLSGFFGKLMVFEAYLSQGWFAISIIAILTSTVSAANYLYLIKTTTLDHGNVIVSRPISVHISPSYLISILLLLSILFICKAELIITITQLLA